MRRKKAIANIFSAFLLEVVTVLAGMVVPRIIISAFGSQTNGLVNSITQFLGYIALLQSGVGSVIRAALYKPLAQKDHKTLCIMVKTTERFFKYIAYATVIYIIILSVLFPALFAKEYDVLFTASLVVIIGISTAAQYLWGMTYQMVLEADQCAYVYSCIQIVTVVLNAICTVFLIKLGYSIQVVKLASAILFILRPFVIKCYSKKKYAIDYAVEVDNSLIAQRWDGMAQAIAYFVHTKTDIFVLTLLSTLENVSIYSVYMLITNGLTALVNCVDKAVRALFGNIIANSEHKKLNTTFDLYVLAIHLLSTICFSTAGVTIFDFIKVYTRGITDAQYIQIPFGYLIVTAEYIYCLRMPYYAIINVAGKFKETKQSSYIEAMINIMVSVIFVKRYGLIGVAVGTCVAMLYRTLSFIRFLHNDILFLDYVKQAKFYIISFVLYVTQIFILSKIKNASSSYMEWTAFAAISFAIISVVVISVYYIFENESMKKLTCMIVGKANSKKRKK